jgi:hypothetical protein
MQFGVMSSELGMKKWNWLKGKKRTVFCVSLLFGLLLVNYAHPQTLTELYVTESGVVLGGIFAFDPGFPAYAFVRGNGILMWINLEVPGAIVEVSLYGNVSLVERAPPGPISYQDGRIDRIGDLRFEYDSGRVRRIGGLRFDYYGWSLGQTGKISRIGDVPLLIEDGFLRRIGNVRLQYRDGMLGKIDELLFVYEDGRIKRIGEVRFAYDYGTLKKVEGEIPGVALKISSVVEIRRSIKSWGELFHDGGSLTVEGIGPHGQGEEIGIVDLQVFHVIHPLVNE